MTHHLQLHQLLPAVFSILLHSALPPSHATHLRTTAAQILAHLLTHYSMTYPGLPVKIVKMLIVGLIEPKKSRATNEGAVRGLMAIGKEAVRLGLVERQGAKLVGEKCMPGESSQLVELIMVRPQCIHPVHVLTHLQESFRMLHPPSARPVPLDPNSGADQAVIEKLHAQLGDFFAERIVGDAAWARGILSDDVSTML